MLRALLNPFGLALLLASLVFAGLVLSVFDRWSEQAIWLTLIGVVAYIASSAVIYLQLLVDEQSSGSEQTVEQEEDQVREQETLPEPELDIVPNFATELDPSVGYRATQNALQRINSLANLSRCDLIAILPRTLSSNHDDPTPLEKAQALSEVLIAAIEKLKPPAGTDAALGYHILREFYVEGRLVAYLLTRFNIAEATYNRHRSAAISAIWSELEAQEGSLS